MSKSLTPWVRFSGPNKPQYQTPLSAGCDLPSAEEVVIPAGEWKLVGTGLFLEIPEGFMAMVCPRSGLALKHGITVLNAPGIIDADYRGEVKVILINHSKQEYSIKTGDRIAQLIFAPAFQASMSESEQLSGTQRGQGGFGSTGV